MRASGKAAATAPLTPTNVRYTAVDPASYQGIWTGTYSNNQKFDLTISEVDGFRAQAARRLCDSNPKACAKSVLLAQFSRAIPCLEKIPA